MSIFAWLPGVVMRLSLSDGLLQTNQLGYSKMLPIAAATLDMSASEIVTGDNLRSTTTAGAIEVSMTITNLDKSDNS